MNTKKFVTRTTTIFTGLALHRKRYLWLRADFLPGPYVQFGKIIYGGIS